jgi:hypothetical protein
MNLNAFVQVQELRIREQLAKHNARIYPNTPERKYTPRKKGGRPAASLLSASDIATIRYELSQPHERGLMNRLAQRFKVSYSAIWNIARKRTWNA